jgi:hypothetical protein
MQGALCWVREGSKTNNWQQQKRRCLVEAELYSTSSSSAAAAAVVQVVCSCKAVAVHILLLMRDSVVANLLGVG